MLELPYPLEIEFADGEDIEDEVIIDDVHDWDATATPDKVTEYVNADDEVIDGDPVSVVVVDWTLAIFGEDELFSIFVDTDGVKPSVVELLLVVWMACCWWWWLVRPTQVVITELGDVEDIVVVCTVDVKFPVGRSRSRCGRNASFNASTRFSVGPQRE